MEYIKSIKTIEEPNEFTFKEKGSTFIGRVYHSESGEGSRELINSDKKEHYNATHVCSAYKQLDGEFKYSDDGEPNGTAGIRIFNAIQHFDLTNVCVTVIRYYGGTKLGVGPLGKAYYYAAHEVLRDSEILTKVNYSLYRVAYDYDFVNSIHHFLSMFRCKIENNLFLEKPALDFLILPENVAALQEKLQEVSNGKIVLELKKENIFIRE
ncbi:MAG: hypothetical protein SCALA702_14000 [Melioribacteraceae bacterium]|nr:MAG: hypothetical protein SCALA702_14000 [Melioribacteraceae bacterium]